MVCETDKMTGIAGVIANQKAWLKEKEAEKAEQEVAYNSAFDSYEKAHAKHRVSSTETHLSDVSIAEKKRQLELLQIEMNNKIRNANTESEKHALRIYYSNLIGNLEAEIRTTEKENVELARTSDADRRTETGKKFDWMGVGAGLQNLYHTLFDGYLDLGKMEQTAHIADVTQDLRTNIDYLG